MFIKGEGGRKAEPIHHRAADAICEAPALVLVGGEDPPGVPHVAWQDPFQVANFAAQNRQRDFEGALELAAYFEQRRQLIDHVIRCDQRLGIGVEPRFGRVMVRIGGYETGKLRSGIDEYAGH